MTSIHRYLKRSKFCKLICFTVAPSSLLKMEHNILTIKITHKQNLKALTYHITKLCFILIKQKNPPINTMYSPILQQKHCMSPNNI